MGEPKPSPDGRTLAVAVAVAVAGTGTGKSEESCGLIDLTAPFPQKSMRHLAPVDATRGFWPAAWSPDGRRMAGTSRTATTPEPGVVIYSFETEKYERVTNDEYPIAWFPDGRCVLYRDKNSLLAVDVATKTTKPVLDDLGIGVGSLALAGDGRTLLSVRTDYQADIWMLGATDRAPGTPSGR